MINLFSQLKIKDIKFKNRIVVSPMCQYSSEDGFANDWHLVHLGSRAVGGAGLIISEACAVSPEGRITPFDLGIWKDDHIEFLKRITQFIGKQGSIPGIQLAHAGRKASKTRPWEGDKYISRNNGGWKTVAPSPIPFDPEDDAPQEMTYSDIQKVVEDYSKAASRALEAGFKVVEIHSAHGYLINEFLSPMTNKRNDAYGGSFENRVKILLEIIKAVKKEWPETYPLFVRLSAVDWHEEGWQLTDSIRLAVELRSLGVDLIDCSSGGNIKNARIPLGPGYQVNFASAIKRETGILTGAVGLIHSADQANEIIMTGKADLVLLAREFLRDPYFPLTAANQLHIDVKWPLQYERAKIKRM